MKFPHNWFSVVGLLVLFCETGLAFSPFLPLSHRHPRAATTLDASPVELLAQAARVVKGEIPLDAALSDFDDRAVARASAEVTERARGPVYGAVGGTVFGLILGVVLDLFLIFKGIDGGIFPPLLAAMALGGAGWTFGGEEGLAGNFVRILLANPVGSVVDEVVSRVENTKAEIGKIPEKAVNEVAKVPSKMADAVKAKVEEAAEGAVQEVAKVPSKVVKAAENKAKEVAQDLAGEVSQIPSKVAGSIKNKAEEAISEATQEVTKIPFKAVQSIKNKF
uniref:Uncharacterized protein n=1 Tax=Corethron hystrix TaxID=216773 RepID=A0A7S1G3C7_9STRA|mmetsp:Transcript_8567/g.18855  ORF Transcript_8567/g.18855 Transcript_8567/m.18855 type:complete len:278 (+) Transcript_8567:149-982(+)